MVEYGVRSRASAGAQLAAAKPASSGDLASDVARLNDACYSCHKSSGKPYLRPMIPTMPPQAIINDDPKATWPQ